MDYSELLKAKDFEDLPIEMDDEEHRGHWKRTVKRKGKVSELLEIWDIDDLSEDSAMAQVLRYLSSASKIIRQIP